MADNRYELLAEGYRRGILPPDMKAAYEEAQKRGLFVASEMQASQQPDYGKMSAGEIATSAVEHVGPSALQMGKDIYQTVRHPIETATNIGNIGKGVLQKLGIMEGKDAEPYADAVGQYLVKKYGSGTAIKETMATDPLGLAADLSMLLTGGGGAAARVPGIVGKAGRVAQKAGDIVNPLNVAGQAVKGAAKAGSEAVGGLLTGTGGKSINRSFMSGAEAITDPSQGKAFRGNFTGKVDPAEVVSDAKDAISGLIKSRGEEYRAELGKVTGTSSLPLSYNKVDRAIDTQINKFHGKVLDESLQQVVETVRDRVEQWKGLPNVFQSPLGFDALKKNIADIRNLPGNTDQFGRLTKQGAVVKNIERAITDTISDADPKYAKVMEAYSSASDIIENLQRELSLGRNANVDTGLRKLQSVLRNNVNTSYGRRERLATFLADNGATTLLSALAGQSMSTLIPRGLAARALAAAQAFFGLEHGAGSEQLLKAAGALTLSSPAVVGGLAHGAGILSSPLYAGAQAGRRVGLGPARLGLGARVLSSTPQ
jgi:hypothetical protein